MIKKATLNDVRVIHQLIAEQAKVGAILPRPMTELYSQVRDFSVYIHEEAGNMVGCSALHIVWEDLAEIRSLAVTTTFQRRGIGGQLIEAMMEEARDMGVHRVFVLTDRIPLFEKHDFELMDKSLLPHKIWADCLRCTKFPECDEVALVRTP
jgi:amino-acid N-acetyltransferase